mgnify:CR=1 FL=1
MLDNKCHMIYDIRKRTYDGKHSFFKWEWTSYMRNRTYDKGHMIYYRRMRSMARDKGYTVKERQ